jgi:RNA polymerase sigma factor for flagellar operon FliA
MAAKLGVTLEEFQKIAGDATAVSLVSLNKKWYETDSYKDVREIQRKDLKELITKGLSRAERLIIILYYFEEMTMKEIGATLDLSESRVSQMHSSILARLKAQMADRRKEFQQAAAV